MIHQINFIVKIAESAMPIPASTNESIVPSRAHETIAEPISDKEVLSALTKKNIIILGIPGAGKTTLVERLKKLDEDINYISVGDISRNLEPDSPERLYLDELFKSEAPIGDPRFFIELIEKDIDTALEDGKGFVLDGIPKKHEEVQPLLDFFESKGICTDAVILCKIDALEAYDRISSRDTRPGDQDSMATFINRTGVYLNDIDEFKDKLTLRGAPILELDTSNLDEDQCVEHLIAMARLNMNKQESLSYDINNLVMALQRGDRAEAAAELAPIFDEVSGQRLPYKELFSSDTTETQKMAIIEKSLLMQDPELSYTPKLLSRLADNYKSTTLGSIEHLVTSIIQELEAQSLPATEHSVDAIVQEQLETKLLISELQKSLIDGKNFSHVIEGEINVNSEELRFISNALKNLTPPCYARELYARPRINHETTASSMGSINIKPDIACT